MKYHDLIAGELRRELRIQGCPGVRGVRSLLDSLSPWLYFHPIPDASDSCCVAWFDGSCDIWAPPDEPYPIMHEVAHALRASAVQLCAPFALRDLRANFLREEGSCHRFARAFLLPALETLSMNGELQEESGCPADVIAQRRLELIRW